MTGGTLCQMTESAIWAVIFDMDGLMFDTESIYSDTSRRASTELGFPFDDAFYRAHFVGRRLVDSEATLREHFGDTFPLDAYRERSERYLRAALPDAARKPGLFELLGWLDARGIALSVATSTVRDLALVTLGDLAARFAFLTTGDEVAHGKPAPDIFTLATARHGCDPARCIVLEDSSAGVRAAHAAGARAIWVPDLQTPTPEVSRLAHRVVPDLHAAIDVIAALAM
jgi:HAD superfamily hydrolase (TIGR01509 family)